MRLADSQTKPGTIHLDGMQRSSLGAAVGGTVQAARVDLPAADRLELTLEGALPADPASLIEGIKTGLQAVPVSLGEQRRLPLIGGRFLSLTVTSIAPGAAALVHDATVITLNGTHAAKPVRRPAFTSTGNARSPASGRPLNSARAAQPHRSAATASAESSQPVTYEDIGGLGNALARVRELIELPLKHPELFERLGITPPRGVLLSGPPGTGKTLIARAVAYESRCEFFLINGPEIVDRFYGASEAQLREIFEQAEAQAPAIVFIDELDAIAPAREDLAGDRQVERRIVAQLLTLLDGLADRGQLIVIAATNLPDKLDPALRRPGRFDREIQIQAPDAPGRLEILQIYTKAMPLADDIELKAVADRCHGYVGADLAALVREAGMAALRRQLDADGLPVDAVAATMTVTLADFERAMLDVAPSMLRAVQPVTSQTRWSDIGGLEAVKTQLREAVEWPLRHGALYEQLNLRPPRGILLAGPPGTGKTLLAKALAFESGVNFIAVKGPELLQRYVGESERALRDVFEKGRQTAPCVLFFDEIDALVPKRGQSLSSSEIGERLVGQLLTELDGIRTLKGVLLLAATNRPEHLDDALLRPGRFDAIIDVGLPGPAQRLDILQVLTRDLPLADDVDLNMLAGRCDGFAGADLESLVRRAAQSSLRAHLHDGGALVVDQAGFAAACAQCRQALQARGMDPSRATPQPSGSVTPDHDHAGTAHV